MGHHPATGQHPPPEPVSFGAELFLGRLRTDLLALPPGDPRRLPAADEGFLDQLRTFCAKEVDGELIERTDRVPDRVIEGLKDIGAFRIRIPVEYGGLGLSRVCYHRALMIASTAHSALGELLAAHQAIGLPQPLLLFGTEEQKRAFLPRCAREISAFTLTEAEVGNDPFPLRTTAVHDPSSGTYTLNGVKLWVTNGVLADLLVVVARVPAAAEDSGEGTGEHSGEGAGGLTVFVVEADAPGVTVEHRGSFLGLRGLENGVVRLHDVVVPAGHRIGEEGAGLQVALAAQDTGRLSLPAVCAAAAKWSLKVAREWAGTRVQWGRPIGEQDAVAGKLAFIAANAFALEAVVEVSGRRAQTPGTDTRLEAELAKLLASERAWAVADELVQLRGGRGFETAASAAARGERGVPVEQLLRDLRIGRIFDGSTEALRSFLAQEIVERHRVGSPPAQVPAGPPPDSATPVAAPLTDHLRYVERTAGELAGHVERASRWPDEEVEVHQRYLGRLVDVGAELYAMAASCVYADALARCGEPAVELADAFCVQARQRIEESLTRLVANTDAADRTLARRVLGSRHTWLEAGVLDPSVDGPWIAEPTPGPTSRPNLRRTVPAPPADPAQQADPAG